MKKNRHQKKERKKERKNIVEKKKKWGNIYLRKNRLYVDLRIDFS